MFLSFQGQASVSLKDSYYITVNDHVLAFQMIMFVILGIRLHKVAYIFCKSSQLLDLAPACEFACELNNTKSLTKDLEI